MTLPATVTRCWQDITTLPGRALHGRPARITARAALATALAITAAALIPGTPAEAADITAATLWWATTSYPELAPPPN
jgi:hypothetical protein